MAITTSDLDFANIKQKLKASLKESGYTDHDFEASGLSSILDVLAYNTHINGLIANMAVNESFLATSQFRSSALAHAETLGYLPKSMTRAIAEVNISVNIPTGPASLTIPAGQTFSASVDDVIYSFKTEHEYIAENDGNGNFVFKTTSGSEVIPLVEGETRRKVFRVGKSTDDNVYIIPDTTIDTDTMVVKVFDNFTGTEYTPYSYIQDVKNITDESHVYMIRETASGEYELFFSDGNILGKGPVAGNRLEVEYQSTKGPDANGATGFTTTDISWKGSLYRPTVSTVTTAAGGADKESLRSIKVSAPRAFVAQNRLVTADDYRGMILSNYRGYVDDVIVWGGNDNVPPEYGKVFVSLLYKEGLEGTNAQTLAEESIVSDLTSNLSIMSIDTEFVPKKDTFLELRTIFQIDATKNITSVEALQVQVNDVINSYVENELNKFGSTFRRSNLLSDIDALSGAILNSRMEVKVQQRLNVPAMIADLNAQRVTNQEATVDYLDQDFQIDFPITLAGPDKDTHTVTSSSFKSNGISCRLVNKLGGYEMQLVDLDGVVLVEKIGYYEPATGKVVLNALRIDGTGFIGDTIKFSAVPANQSTIRPLRSYILQVDAGASYTRGRIDDGVTQVEL